MTAYTVTVSENLNLFGGAPSNKWNASYALWGSFNWGEGSEVLGGYVEALAAAETLTLSESMTIRIPITISESLTVSDGIGTIYLYDSAGYYHVFYGQVTDLDASYEPTWSEVTADSETWTEASTPSTTWS